MRVRMQSICCFSLTNEKSSRTFMKSCFPSRAEPRTASFVEMRGHICKRRHAATKKKYVLNTDRKQSFFLHFRDTRDFVHGTDNMKNHITTATNKWNGILTLFLGPWMSWSRLGLLHQPRHAKLFGPTFLGVRFTLSCRLDTRQEIQACGLIIDKLKKKNLWSIHLDVQDQSRDRI